MKPILGLVFVLLVAGAHLLGPAKAGADLGAFTIARFHTELTVQPDAGLMVEERLTVDFSEPRHGLYRTIPVRYVDKLGYAYSLNLRLLEVVDENGHSHGSKMSRRGSSVQIRIGSPDRKVTGRVVYVIRYHVEEAVVQLAELDQVYWNATGNEWQTTIAEASVRIRLPAPLPSDSLEIAAFTGRFGSRETDAVVRVAEPGTILVESTRRLGPREGLTVAVAWPRGHVSFPGALQRTGRILSNNWILVAPFLVFGFLWQRYRKHGRDPEGPAAVMVRYEPPTGVTPAEVGTLLDEKVDLRDVTAVVVDLAVRGYLVIHKEESTVLFFFKSEETVFERTEKSMEGLLPHEQRVLNGIFDTGSRVPASELKNAFYKHIPGIQSAVYDRLTEQGLFAGNPSSVRRRYAVAGFVAGLLVFGVGMASSAVLGGSATPIPAIVAGVLTLVLFVSFAPAMPRRTREGVRVRAWAQGFEEFVNRVEGDRLRAQAEDPRTAFETLLPYAMALGIATEWARQFQGIYQSGGAPTWYMGPHVVDSFSTLSLEQSLSSSMGEVGKMMAASPRSSGTGGGGSSGGGGGGGGGGSW